MSHRHHEDGIREELERLRGQRVVVFLEGFLVEGTVEKVGRDVVTLRADATDPVEVESTAAADTNLETMVLIKIRIRKIIAVGPETAED